MTAVAALTRDSECLTREIFFVCNYRTDKQSLFMALLKYHFGVFHFSSNGPGQELALTPQLQELVRHMDGEVVSFHD